MFPHIVPHVSVFQFLVFFCIGGIVGSFIVNLFHGAVATAWRQMIHWDWAVWNQLHKHPSSWQWIIKHSHETCQGIYFCSNEYFEMLHNCKTCYKFMTVVKFWDLVQSTVTLSMWNVQKNKVEQLQKYVAITYHTNVKKTFM